jgi:hypothetical protein
MYRRTAQRRRVHRGTATTSSQSIGVGAATGAIAATTTDRTTPERTKTSTATAIAAATAADAAGSPCAGTSSSAECTAAVATADDDVSSNSSSVQQQQQQIVRELRHVKEIGAFRDNGESLARQIVRFLMVSYYALYSIFDTTARSSEYAYCSKLLLLCAAVASQHAYTAH